MKKFLYLFITLFFSAYLVGCAGYNSKPMPNPNDNEFDKYNCTSSELSDASLDRCNAIRYENYIESQDKQPTIDKP